MGEPGIGRIRGFCACRAPRTAQHPGYGRTGYWGDPGFLRAPRAAHCATSRLWANRVLGGSGVFAGAARPCAARHPGYGRTGYWADTGSLRAPRDFPVMGEPGIGRIRGFCACRATSRLRGNRVLGGSEVFARATRRAPRDIPVMGEPGIGRIRGFCACRATSRLWANRVLGGSGVFARTARRAPRDIRVMGEMAIGRIRGFCARSAPRDLAVMGEPGSGRIPGFCACRATFRLWGNRVFGVSGVFARAARRATSRLLATRVLGGSEVFAHVARLPGYGRTGYWVDPGFWRAQRDIPVMSEPGIWRIEGFCARRATSQLWANRVTGGS